MICHNRTLCELVRLVPGSLPELLNVWGIGAKRIETHGQLMLDALLPFRSALLTERAQMGWAGVALDEAEVGAGAKPRASTGLGDSSTHEAALLVSAKPQTRHDTVCSEKGQTAQRPRRSSSAAAAAWDEEAGTELASEGWRAQREALGLPAGPWSERRRRCARVHGCDACKSYAAEGREFEYAPMSQRVLDMLCSPGAYGSAAAAQAAGWRWNAQPNHGQRSHAHQWWPPQAVIDELLPAGTKLPIGTYKAYELLDALF